MNLQIVIKIIPSIREESIEKAKQKLRPHWSRTPGEVAIAVSIWELLRFPLAKSNINFARVASSSSWGHLCILPDSKEIKENTNKQSPHHLWKRKQCKRRSPCWGIPNWVLQDTEDNAVEDPKRCSKTYLKGHIHFKDPCSLLPEGSQPLLNIPI